MEIHSRTFRSASQASDFIKALSDSHESRFHALDVNDANNIRVEYRWDGDQNTVAERMTETVQFLNRREQN